MICVSFSLLYFLIINFHLFVLVLISSWLGEIEGGLIVSFGKGMGDGRVGQHVGITGNKCQIPKGKVGQEWANFPNFPHRFCLQLKSHEFHTY